MPDEILRTTWAWEWTNLAEEVARFPKPKSAVGEWPAEWNRKPVLRQKPLWWWYWWPTAAFGPYSRWTDSGGD
jgi:hypothetical protein